MKTTRLMLAMGQAGFARHITHFRALKSSPFASFGYLMSFRPVRRIRNILEGWTERYPTTFEESTPIKKWPKLT